MVKSVFNMFMTYDIQLSKYFKLREFLYSATAERHGIVNCPHNYTYFGKLLENLQQVAKYLDIVRELQKAPVYITSGYRNKHLNDKVDGSPFSDHLQGAAVDITASDFEKLKDNLDWLYLDSPDVFYYFNDDKRYAHISYRKVKHLNREKNECKKST